jgi:hypothetical protein
MQKGMRDELTEHVARALCRASYDTRKFVVPEEYEVNEQLWLADARAAINAIEEFQKKQQTIVVPMGNIPR